MSTDTERNDEYKIRFKKFKCLIKIYKQTISTKLIKKKKVLLIDIVSLSRVLSTSPTPFTFLRPLLCTQLFLKKKKWSAKADWRKRQFIRPV